MYNSRNSPEIQPSSVSYLVNAFGQKLIDIIYILFFLTEEYMYWLKGVMGSAWTFADKY